MRRPWLTGALLLALAPAVAAEPADPPQQRRQLEIQTRENPYAITPHKPNFLLPLSYTHRPHAELLGNSVENLDRFEVKFQLSFKVSLWRDLAGLPADLYFAYTGLSFWQAYNASESSPFRDTNHEPEVFVRTYSNWRWGPLADINLRAGFSHQSNGRALPLSRSWNRVYTGVDFRWRRFYLDLVIWDRIPEDTKDGPDDPRGDDNPDIERFMGHGRLSAAWAIDGKTVRLALRNNLRRGDNKGALTAAFSYPMTSELKGYVELFTGYGESLIDYNRSAERLSLGIAITDWP